MDGQPVISLYRLYVGSTTVDEALIDMAFYQGRSDQGEGLVLFWCHVRVLLRLDVWDGPRVSLL